MIRRETFLKELSVAVPESGAVVIEHMADNDGLLLHLLMSDLVRMSVSSDCDRLMWPHRDGLIWPHGRRAGVVVTV